MTITVGTGITVETGITIDGSITVVPPANGVNWTNLAYGNGAYVAIGGVGGGPSSTGAISYDGLTWTSTTMPLGEWEGIIYGVDRFVAVGSGSTAAYSLDGVNWTASTLPSTQNWGCIAYGAGIFVAMGMSNTGGSTPNYAISSDGITWTAKTIVTGNWTAIVYGNLEFAAITAAGRSAVSSDGLSWTTSTGSLASCYSIAYGNGIYVKVSELTSPLDTAWSTDGLTWNSDFASGSSALWQRVVFGNGLFVATPFNSTNESIVSSDGINWTTNILPAAAGWRGLAYGPGLYKGFVTIGNDPLNNSVSAISRNGTVWY